MERRAIMAIEDALTNLTPDQLPDDPKAQLMILYFQKLKGKQRQQAADELWRLHQKSPDPEVERVLAKLVEIGDIQHPKLSISGTSTPSLAAEKLHRTIKRLYEKQQRSPLSIRSIYRAAALSRSDFDELLQDLLERGLVQWDSDRIVPVMPMGTEHQGPKD
jgi:hypothetical protein